VVPELDLLTRQVDPEQLESSGDRGEVIYRAGIVTQLQCYGTDWGDKYSPLTILT